MINKNISVIIPEELYDEEKEITERVKNGESIEQMRLCVLPEMVTKFQLVLWFLLIKDSNGNVIAVSKIARDISEKS